MTEADFQIAITHLVGRMAMIEALNAHMLAHLCSKFDDPEALARRILDGVEDRLANERRAAPDAEREIALAAITSYGPLSRSIFAMVRRIATLSRDA